MSQRPHRFQLTIARPSPIRFVRSFVSQQFLLRLLLLVLCNCYCCPTSPSTSPSPFPHPLLIHLLPSHFNDRQALLYVSSLSFAFGCTLFISFAVILILKYTNTKAKAERSSRTHSGSKCRVYVLINALPNYLKANTFSMITNVEKSTLLFLFV